MGSVNCGLVDPDTRQIIGFIDADPSATIEAPDTVRLGPHPLELHFTELGTATIVAEGMTHGENGERIRGTVSKAIVVVP
jgi:hypothetical protein